MSANAATSRAASLCAVLFLPAVVFHDEACHGLDLFLRENKAFALIPVPGLLVLTYAAQEYLVRQMRSGEGEQPSPERTALKLWCDEKLVEVTFWQMQRQHGSKRAAVVGDEKAPALFDLLRDPGAQRRQQEITRVFEAGRNPALHPDARDLVIFVGAGGADHRWRHRQFPPGQPYRAAACLSRATCPTDP